jgi:hypothetical protein
MCSPTCKSARPVLSKRPSADALQYGSVNNPGANTGTFPLRAVFLPLLQGLYEYRRSGSNRHGAFAPPEFESSLLRPGLSRYVRESGINRLKTQIGGTQISPAQVSETKG